MDGWIMHPEVYIREKKLVSVEKKSLESSF